MAQAVSPSNDKSLTKGQADKFADLFVDALVKSGLSSEPTQLALEQQGAALTAKFVQLVREQVDALSKITRRTVMVDRSLSPEAAIAATGRRQYVTADVLASMPKGTDETLIIEFIPLEKWMSDEAVDAKLAEYGLVTADPFALAAFNTVEPAFADDRPCFTHWRDAEGKWCDAAFYDWSGGRCVDVSRHEGDWGDGWWVAGVRK